MVIQVTINYRRCVECKEQKFEVNIEDLLSGVKGLNIKIKREGDTGYFLMFPEGIYEITIKYSEKCVGFSAFLDGQFRAIDLYDMISTFPKQLIKKLRNFLNKELSDVYYLGVPNISEGIVNCLKKEFKSVIENLKEILEEGLEGSIKREVVGVDEILIKDGDILYTIKAYGKGDSLYFSVIRKELTWVPQEKKIVIKHNEKYYHLIMGIEKVLKT